MDGLTSLFGKSVAPFVDISTRVWQKVVSQVLLVALKGHNIQQNYKSIAYKLHGNSCDTIDLALSNELAQKGYRPWLIHIYLRYFHFPSH